MRLNNKFIFRVLWMMPYYMATHETKLIFTPLNKFGSIENKLSINFFRHKTTLRAAMLDRRLHNFSNIVGIKS